MPKTLIADAYHLNGFGTCEIQTLLALLSDTKIARIRELAAACASLDVSWIEVEDDDIICKRPAKAVLTGETGYSAGRATRQGSSSLTRFTGQSAITFSTCRR